MTVLARWRTRCQVAVETGEGLPRPWWLLGFRDRRRVRGLVEAISATAEQTQAIDAWVLVSKMAATYGGGLQSGLQLALRWLTEERAAECFRRNGESGAEKVAR